jgi:hypothetical protein
MHASADAAAAVRGADARTGLLVEQLARAQSHAQSVASQFGEHMRAWQPETQRGEEPVVPPQQQQQQQQHEMWNPFAIFQPFGQAVEQRIEQGLDVCVPPGGVVPPAGPPPLARRHRSTRD